MCGAIKDYCPLKARKLLADSNNLKHTLNILLVAAQYSNPTIHRGEFLSYGVLYAIGQDVGVGEVGNLLERFIASAYLERNGNRLV